MFNNEPVEDVNLEHSFRSGVKTYLGSTTEQQQTAKRFIQLQTLQQQILEM